VHVVAVAGLPCPATSPTTQSIGWRAGNVRQQAARTRAASGCRCRPAKRLVEGRRTSQDLRHCADSASPRIVTDVRRSRSPSTARRRSRRKAFAGGDTTVPLAKARCRCHGARPDPVTLTAPAASPGRRDSWTLSEGSAERRALQNDAPQTGTSGPGGDPGRRPCRRHPQKGAVGGGPTLVSSAVGGPHLNRHGHPLHRSLPAAGRSCHRTEAVDPGPRPVSRWCCRFRCSRAAQRVRQCRSGADTG